MQLTAPQQPPRRTWYQKLGMIVLWPFVFPVALVVLPIFLVAGVYAWIAILVGETLFRIRMWRFGRFLNSRQLSNRIAEEGAGTLLIETPSLGWSFTHGWWTPDNIRSLCPYPVPSDDEYRSAAQKPQCLAWDRWHWDNYIDPAKGRGFLLRVWNGRSLAKRLQQTFPAMDVVYTWTALVHYGAHDEKCDEPPGTISSDIPV